MRGLGKGSYRGCMRGSRQGVIRGLYEGVSARGLILGGVVMLHVIRTPIKNMADYKIKLGISLT